MSDDHERDAATEAFTGLRADVERQGEEIVLLRRAIEGMAAARAEVPDMPEFPDYSETLAKQLQGIAIVMREVAALQKLPALDMTPEQMAARITAAGATVRRADHDALTRAASDMTAAAREVRGIVASAWTAERQRMHQLWFALGGLVVGILLWMVLPGLVARELAPASWQWPEKLAARSLGVDSMWAGARRMAAVGAPDTWNMMIDGADLERENQAALARCRKAARDGKPVKCTVMISPVDGDAGGRREE